MADQEAKQDGNKFPALIAHTGTAGTAETERVTSTDGALNVDIVSGEIVASLGTVKVLEAGSVVVTTGTIGDLDTVGTVGVVNAGSVVITSGTIGDLDTVGTIGVLNAGSVVVTAGTIGDLDTVGTVGVLNTGSVVVTTGTISDLDTVGTVGVLNAGSVAVTAGTIEDKTYALKVDGTTTSDVTYVGEAAIGASGTAASWRIKKIDETTTDMVDITWADGNGNFDNLWSGRGTINYS